MRKALTGLLVAVFTTPLLAAPAQPELGVRAKPIITAKGLRFKDLNANGLLDTYEDWRLPARKRAIDLVRRMTLADVPQVHAIEERTFATPWSYQSFVDEMTTNKCARYLVAEEDGRVIAYAGAWLIFEEGHITNIAVDEPYRGRGVGTEVTRALMQYAANMGVQYLTLEVRQLRETAWSPADHLVAWQQFPLASGLAVPAATQQQLASKHKVVGLEDD